MHYAIAILLQFLYACMNLLTKSAMNNGMSNDIVAAYRSMFALGTVSPFALYYDRNQLPPMTWLLFLNIFVLSLLGVLDQELDFWGMSYTTPTLATATSNMQPAITFILALIFRMETLNILSKRDQSKVAGAILLVLGAMVMTLVGGPLLYRRDAVISHSHPSGSNTLLGLGLVLVSCISSALFNMLQATILEYYPPLFLLSWVFFLGSMECVLVAWAVESRSEYSVWLIFRSDVKLLAVLYAGVFCSGLGYYLRGVVTRARGTVFASSFGPLCMIMVAIFGIFLFGEALVLGRVLGVVIICLGIFFAMWGQVRDIAPVQDDDQPEGGEVVPAQEG